MIIAPVMIPTCNRIDHLKRCLETLSLNSLAPKTKIYISVDYPPSEKYIEGNSKIKCYLESFDKTVFEDLVVIFQKENLGPRGNFWFLYYYLKNNGFDRFIFSEDDNEFSPNFLEYINDCFEMNKEDSAFTICGFKSDSDVFADYNHLSGTIYKTLFTQPFGYGCFFSNYERFLKEKECILEKKNYLLRNIKKLINYNPYLACIYVEFVLCRKNNLFFEENDKLAPIDGVMQLYGYYKNLNSIFPTQYKSRTRGIDGSGVSMGRDESINLETDWKLDESKSFKYIELQSREVDEELNKSHLRFKKKYKRRLVMMYLRLMIFYLSMCNAKKANKVICFLESLYSKK